MRPLPILLSLLLIRSTATPGLGAESLRTGESRQVGGQRVTVTSIDTLPFVDDEYTRRFRFDRFENPKLGELRSRYALESVVAAGVDEFGRQVLLNAWAHAQFTRFGRPSTNAQGALEILGACRDGHIFFCKQYAEVLLSAAASLGWVGRPLALRRHQGANRADGSTEHTVIELWSNQHRKWVMFDPTSRMHIERDAVPLNAFEIRQEWFYRQGTNLTFVVGAGRQPRRKADLPIVLGRFPDFGTLALHTDELDKYGFIGYIPNSDLMDSGYAYDRMFITRDALCDGTSWHIRPGPARPDLDPYFPMGQSTLDLTVNEGVLQVRLRTFTPNLDRFERRHDDGDWMPTDASFAWRLPAGAGVHRISTRTVNRFGVPGPVASAEITVAP